MQRTVYDQAPRTRHDRTDDVRQVPVRCDRAIPKGEFGGDALQRFKQRMMRATVGMYGDLQGVSGKSRQEIEELEMGSLDGDATPQQLELQKKTAPAGAVFEINTAVMPL